MADNYLEKRYDEVFSGRGGASRKGASGKKGGHNSIDSLFLRNRSVRGYDPSRVVTVGELKEIVGVCRLVPSGRNQQVLRFRLVTKEAEKVCGDKSDGAGNGAECGAAVIGGGADLMQGLYKLGGALPELHLPFPGTEPEAFIIVCSTVEENRIVDMDMGIAAQSMLLKCTDMGLNGIIIAAFNREKVKEVFSLPYLPALLIAVGKSAEKFQILPIHPEDNHNYFRESGVHFVPKLTLDDMLI